MLVLKLDVEKETTIQTALAKAIERFGTIDVLLNNAGYGTMGLIEAATEGQIRRQFEVNVLGLIRMTKAKVKLIEPGAIHTDFGGRSMEFFYNDDLTDYKLFTAAFRAKLGDMEKQPAYASPPEMVAETIYQAATDGTSQFRYIVGDDAKMIIQMKENTDEEEYLTNIAQHFA